MDASVLNLNIHIHITVLPHYKQMYACQIHSIYGASWELSRTNSVDLRNQLVKLTMVPQHCVKPVAMALYCQMYYEVTRRHKKLPDSKQHCQLCLVSTSPQTHTHKHTHTNLSRNKQKLERNRPINQKVRSLVRQPITRCDKRLEISPSLPSISTDFHNAMCMHVRTYMLIHG